MPSLLPFSLLAGGEDGVFAGGHVHEPGEGGLAVDLGDGKIGRDVALVDLDGIEDPDGKEEREDRRSDPEVDRVAPAGPGRQGAIVPEDMDFPAASAKDTAAPRSRAGLPFFPPESD